jgi:hypothetical protein
VKRRLGWVFASHRQRLRGGRGSLKFFWRRNLESWAVFR